MATVSSNTTDFGLATDRIFLRAPRLNKDDIGESLSGDDIDLLEEFEDAWKEFLSARPGTLPPGQKIKNFRNIQTRMNEVQAKKENVCLELRRQLDFFASSRGRLEEKYSRQKEEATLQQKGMVEELEQEIDRIAIADKLLSEVLPWEHYFHNLESNTSALDNGGVANMSAATGRSQPIRPSAEALYLANIKPNEITDAPGREAHLHQAYRIDNAILKAKSAMLKREADRLEKNILSDRVLSKFLMDNDVWGAIASSKKWIMKM